MVLPRAQVRSYKERPRHLCKVTRTFFIGERLSDINKGALAPSEEALIGDAWIAIPRYDRTADDKAKMSQERLHHPIVRMRIDTDIGDLLEAPAKDQACDPPYLPTRGQAVDHPIGLFA